MLLKRTVLILVIIFLSNVSSFGKPRNITWSDLEILKNGKIPKNSKKQDLGGLFESGAIEVMFYTPSACAARFAKRAKDEFIKLDSNNYNPSLFNNFIEMHVTNLMKSDIREVRQFQRCVIEIGDEHHEVDSVIYLKENYQNAYGAEAINIDAIFFLPMRYFTGSNDVNLYIFDDRGKIKRKLKKKQIAKLE